MTYRFGMACLHCKLGIVLAGAMRAALVVVPACTSDTSAISLRCDASANIADAQSGSDSEQDVGETGLETGPVRLLFEDCEYEDGSLHFLERHYGTNYQSYFERMIELVGQSSETPVGGSYCATWNPWVDSNFKTVLGLGTVSHGNTSEFSIGDALAGGTQIYFRWWMRWQLDIDYGSSAQRTLLSVNGDGGDFSLALNKSGSEGLHLNGSSHSPDELRENLWLTHSGGPLDDLSWHKFEVFLDWTDTGATGVLWIEIDDIELVRRNDWYFRDSDEAAADIERFSIPGGTSGTPSGDSQEWWDDIEVWNSEPDGD